MSYRPERYRRDRSSEPSEQPRQVPVPVRVQFGLRILALVLVLAAAWVVTHH